jgi:hypothetical protein
MRWRKLVFFIYKNVNLGEIITVLTNRGFKGIWIELKIN